MIVFCNYDIDANNRKCVDRCDHDTQVQIRLLDVETDRHIVPDVSVESTAIVIVAKSDSDGLERIR